jgi:hypothetical protein
VSQTQQRKIRKPRILGSSKGLIKMADDFDTPLENFKDYMLLPTLEIRQPPQFHIIEQAIQIRPR